MSHFASIGLDGATPEEMQQLVGRAAEAAGNPPALAGHEDHHAWFHDPSGASLAIHLEGKEVECMTPFFAAPAGGTIWKIRTGAPHLDRECRHCSGADCDVLDRNSGEMLTRATVQWLFFAPYESWLTENRTYDLEVVGFASALTLAADAEGLERAQADMFGERQVAAAPTSPEKPLRLAEGAFLPYGMFEKGGNLGTNARALLAGTISQLSTPTNTLSGRRFVRLRVGTLAGELEVVAPESALAGAPATPTLALADVWLVGRPLEPPPPPSDQPRGGWFKRLISV